MEKRKLRAKQRRRLTCDCKSSSVQTFVISCVCVRARASVSFSVSELLTVAASRVGGGQLPQLVAVWDKFCITTPPLNLFNPQL